MRLNAQTDYSLRIMMLLAAKGGTPTTIQEVAARLGLSQTHTMRIAAKLTSSGLVRSIRGRSGGLALGRDSSLISVEEVVRAIEPDFNLVQCFHDSPNRCSIEPACLLKGAFASALSAFFAELRAVSLAELTEPNRLDLAEIFRLSDTNYQPRGRAVDGDTLPKQHPNGVAI